MIQQIPALAIDFGGTIIAQKYDTQKHLFGPDYKRVPADGGAFYAIRQMACNGFRNNTYVVTRARSIKSQLRVLQWLKEKNFTRETGVSTQKVIFTETNEEKVEVCKQLGVTHYIDNRLDVLRTMVGIVPNLYLINGSLLEEEKNKDVLPYVTTAHDWFELERIISGYKL